MFINNYIVEFLIYHKSYFCIWHSDIKDIFWIEENKIVYFTELSELHNFCQDKKIQVDDKVTTFDIDKLIGLLNASKLEIDCDYYLNIWNIFHDCAYSVGQMFYGDKKKLNHIYSKLFYGNNISVINKGGDKYKPVFSVSEKNKLIHVFKEGMQILLDQFNLELF